MTVCELRKKAAGIIRERGLAKGTYGTPNGPVCILGALGEALHGRGVCLSRAKAERDPLFQQALREMNLSIWRLRNLGFLGEMDADRWNDNPARTAEEVIARLEDCQ